MLSQYLPYEGINQNAINAEQSITAIIIYSRQSAVPQVADKLRQPIRRPFQPEGDDTRDLIDQTNHYYRCQVPRPDITAIGDSQPDTTLSPSRAKQLSRRNKAKSKTNVA